MSRAEQVNADSTKKMLDERQEVLRAYAAVAAAAL
jgi:hypothetical protein